MKKKTLDITGLALIEGVMIKHQGEYAMALRKGNSDIEIIHEIRHYPILYSKLIKDVKRYVSLVAKKMR